MFFGVVTQDIVPISLSMEITSILTTAGGGEVVRINDMTNTDVLKERC